MKVSRRKMMGGIAAGVSMALAGCISEDEPTNENNFRFHTEVSSDTNGDTLIVNVEGRMNVVSSECAERVDVLVELFVGGEKRAEKEIEVPETNRGTGWGVTFLIDHTTESIDVEVTPLEARCP